MSLTTLTELPSQQKRAAFRRLIPSRIFDHLAQLNPSQFDKDGLSESAFRVIAEPGATEAHLRVPAKRYDGDFCLSLDLAEGGAGQMDLSFIVVNDLTAPRFDIDVDTKGNLTLLGTASRNIDEEIRAMEAGLGPCQVRRGLRVFVDLLPRLETCAHDWGYVSINLEPLTYHTAVMYENYGFAYVCGHKRMMRINEAFAEGGILFDALDNTTPFRQRHMARSARGRSWAIHDGILEHLDGDPTFNIQMVKVIGKMAKQHTFYPDAD